MSPRILVLFCLLITVLLITDFARAQQTRKVARVGYLSLQFPRSASGPNIEAFRQRLRELGYIDKQNIVIEWRFASGQLDRLPTLAAELVGLKVNIIVTQGNPAARAAKRKTSTIPIVVVAGTDLVGNRLVASLAHPNENITGVTTYSHELSGKRLGLLKEIVPKAFHFGILHNRNNRALKEMNTVAQALRIKIEPFEVPDTQQLDSIFSTMNQHHVEAFVVQGQSVLASHRQEILRFAAESRLPGIYAWGTWATAGGLSSYAASESEPFHRAATYVDKILKGARPGDLPIEQPMKFEFIINLRAAKQIGLTIPQSVLYQADKVIR